MQHRSKNKTAWILPMLLSFIIVCSGCSDEDYVPKDSLAVRFVPSHAVPGSGTTRVNLDNEWTGRESFGICMIEGSTLPAGSTFNTYIPRQSDSYPTDGITLDPMSIDQTLYFPSNGDKRRFIAYAPAGTIVNEYYVNYDLSDQSTLEKMEQVDFIYHKGTTDYSKYSTSVPMEFTHNMSRIVITLTKGDGTSDENFLKQKDLRLTSMPLGSMDLRNGSYGGASSGCDIAPYRSSPATIDKDTEKIICQAIVYPGRIEFDARIDFGGVTMHGLEGHTFESGKSYEYNFIMKGTDVILNKTTIVDWLGGTVEWNWKYYLQVEEKELTHYKEASTQNTVIVKTDYGNTPTANAVSTGNWIKNCVVKRVNGTEYKLTYDVNANPGSARSGKIIITAGTLSAEIQVNQSNEENPVIYGAERTNCYLLPPGGKTVVIPVEATVEAFRSYYPEHPAVYDEEDYEPVIIWSDVAIDGAPTTGNDISIHQVMSLGAAVADLRYDKTIKSITVTSGEKEGNVLVGLMNYDGELLWSWHLWVTDYAPTRENSLEEGKNYVMQYNLGSSNENGGVIYQRGRKDPLKVDGVRRWQLADMTFKKYTCRYSHEESYEKNLDLTEVVQRPEVIYAHTGGTVSQPWTSEKRGKLRWDQNYDERALNDPCPYSWRMTYINDEKCENYVYSDFGALSIRWRDYSISVWGDGVYDGKDFEEGAAFWYRYDYTSSRPQDQINILGFWGDGWYGGDFVGAKPIFDLTETEVGYATIEYFATSVRCCWYPD